MTDIPSVATIHFELFSTSFCGACKQTRTVLGRVLQLVPGTALTEHDLAFEPDLAHERGIEHSPTILIRDNAGNELFRAAGVPTVPQVLAATAHVLDGMANAGGVGPDTMHRHRRTPDPHSSET